MLLLERVEGGKAGVVESANQASVPETRSQPGRPDLQGFAEPSDGLEPSTPSLPWRTLPSTSPEPARETSNLSPEPTPR